MAQRLQLARTGLLGLLSWLGLRRAFPSATVTNVNANANQHQQATRRGGNAYLRMAVCPWRCYTAVSLSLFLEDDGVPTLLKRQVPLLARRLRSAQDLSTRQALGVPPSILSSFFGFVPRCRSISESPFGLAAGGRHGKAGLDIEIRWSLRVSSNPQQLETCVSAYCGAAQGVELHSLF